MCRLMICLIGFTTAVQTANAAGLKWMREIETPPIKAATLVAVPLDLHFYANTRTGWPDVRVVNSQGDAQGFVIRQVRESKDRLVRTFWTAEQTSAKVDDERGLTIELALREKEPIPQGIRIVTPLKDFERQIHVESSLDGTTWESTGPPTLIFDYSQYVNARNDLVPFAANHRRRFRLIVNDLTTEQESHLLELHRRLQGKQEVARTEQTIINRRPFRVDRVEFYHEEHKIDAGKPELVSDPVKQFQVTEDDKLHQTIVTIPAERQPVTQIRILTDNENFSRFATIEAESLDDVGGHVRHKFTGTLTQFSIGTIQKNETTLSLDETTAIHFRVLIENRDSTPLKITGVELAGPKHELIYLASPGAELHLEYGSPDVEAGRFDTGAIQAALAEHHSMVAGELRPPRDNPHSTQIRGPWKPWNNVWLLGGGLLLLVALLGWGLYQASLKITPPPAS